MHCVLSEPTEPIEHRQQALVDEAFRTTLEFIGRERMRDGSHTFEKGWNQDNQNEQLFQFTVQNKEQAYELFNKLINNMESLVSKSSGDEDRVFLHFRRKFWSEVWVKQTGAEATHYNVEVQVHESDVPPERMTTVYVLRNDEVEFKDVPGYTKTKIQDEPALWRYTKPDVTNLRSHTDNLTSLLSESHFHFAETDFGRLEIYQDVKTYRARIQFVDLQKKHKNIVG